MISSIRSALSVSITDLAEILKVKRETIYSWINEETQPSELNKIQLEELHRLAVFWNKHCHLAIGVDLLRQADQGRCSLLDLLKADKLDQSEIQRRLRSLAVIRKETSVANHTFFDRQRITDQRHIVDTMFGKRMGE